MNKIEKGRKTVIWVGVAILVLSLIGFGIGIMLTVFGAKGIATGSGSGKDIGILVCGLLLILIGLPLIPVGIYFTWTGASIVATKGSIADSDLCKGTVNMKKCDKCGCEISDEDKHCGNCGASLEKTKTCPHCGSENGSKKRKCTACGKDLKA